MELTSIGVTRHDVQVIPPISISTFLRRLFGKRATGKSLRVESEERFRMLVEFAPDSIVVHRDLRIIGRTRASTCMTASGPQPNFTAGR